MDMSLSAQISRMQAICIREYDYDTWTTIHEFIKDEEYDETSIPEDLCDADTCSSIIDYACKTLNITNDKHRNKLQAFLKDSCMGNIPLLIDIDPTDIKPQITITEVKNYRKLISQLCPHLSSADQNQDLMKVMKIGSKNNLPLLTLLFDTYSRVRVDKYIDTGGPNYISSKGHMPEIITIEDFKNYYSFYKKLIAKGHRQFVEILHNATKTFGKRLFPQLVFQPVYKIDDNIIDYVQYVLQGRKFVNTLITTILGYVPFQVDFVIIPRKVESAVIKYIGDDVPDDPEIDPDPEPQPQCLPLDIGNIRERLQLNEGNGWKFSEMKSNPTADVLFRRMKQLYTDKLLVAYNSAHEEKKSNEPNSNANSNKTNETRFKRVVIVVDRRHLKENMPMPIPTKPEIENASKVKDDTMYIVLGPTELTELDVRNLLFEQSLSYSKSLILPPNEGVDNCTNLDELLMNRSCIGCTADCKGFMFVLSFICHSSDIIRAYWFINGSGTRFFAEDMIQLWPGYFTEKQVVKYKQELKKSKSLKESIREMKLPDPVFESWYQATTSRLINTH